ncbi:hypothetical protein GIB67_042292 [Kingdonia uniflora]|uniref:Aminotransferase-like plant mobile domain-containing protein n=1 Tax=Kingdonia uniflora TaxID=39325 RepID=A0A7J7LE95_9MAGN|nr:hypothetical protein GIB67_042292 [Kingdonia uniflora]
MNDLGGGSAEEALGVQRTDGDVMNEDNVEAPPMSEEPQTEVSHEEIADPIDDTYPPDRSLLLSFKFHRARSIYLGQEPGCHRVHHHAPTWHLDKEPTIIQDLVMLAGLDRISEISYEHCNAGLIFAICEHWQPETNTFHFSWGEMILSLDNVQYLIGFSADGDVPITEGSWSLPKLVEIFKKNLYQDEDVFNSMKTGGKGNSLSLVKLLNFYAGKLEKYNDNIQNKRPDGQKKKAMSALFVARTYMLYVLGTIFLPVKKGSYVSARYLYLFEKDKANIKWSWGSVVLAYLFHNLGAASRIDGKQFAAYTTLLETGARELLKYREAFDNYKVEDVVWDPYRAQRRSDHDFNENTFFNGLTSSPDHVEPIYPNRIIKQFARIQPIPKNPKCVEVSGLRTWYGDGPKQYKPKYGWVDAFSKGLWKEWIVRSRNRGRRLGGPAQCVEGYMQWFQSVSWTKICPPTVDLSVNGDIGLPACDPIGRVRSKSNNCDVPMEVLGEVPNICEHEQYLMRRDENKLLVEQISALKEEVQKMKDQKKQKQENEKERYEMIIEKLTEKATECKQLRDENKALVEHISALKEEVEKMKEQKKQETKKETYEMNKLTEKASIN